MNDFKLTQYSHGAGCGCKISPEILDQILKTGTKPAGFDRLMVGYETKDDAAVYDLDGDTAIISTTDFFMPIVDDPFDFGAIAATNAISDIYAMGGRPIMAIAILGWPIDKLPPEVAGKVLEGGRAACARAGIPLAGGHSIDAPEPIFGLAVTGVAPKIQIRKNSDGKPGDLLYLTKPLGIGIVTTAQKKGLADLQDLALAKASMQKLNDIGFELAKLSYVNAITDVTGFGLGGHLIEICEASKCSAQLIWENIPVFKFAYKYLDLGCIPGGTHRNWKSYGSKINISEQIDFRIMADPQTSGGLLFTVNVEYRNEIEKFLKLHNYNSVPIGSLTAGNELVRISFK